MGEHGYDAVIISGRLRPVTTSQYIPGYVETRPVTAYSPWRGRYYTYFTEVETPGLRRDHHHARLRASVWSTRVDDDMIWSGVLETTEAVDQAAVRKAVAKNIVAEMEKVGLVSPRRG